MAQDQGNERSVEAPQVQQLIEMLDTMAYQKPAGFIAYMATCLSSWGGAGNFLPKKSAEVNDDIEKK